MRLLTWILFCTILKTYTVNALTDQQRLVNALFADYDKSLRPVASTADIINVTLNPGLLSIVQTDEAFESITIAQSFRMIWNDVFMRWNPSDYGGMQQLMVPINRIWYPDMNIANIIERTYVIPEEKNYAHINHNGTILISIEELLKMHCNYDITLFPFDLQNCTMQVGSWMHTRDQMDIFFSTPTDIFSYKQNSQWDLISMMAHKLKEFFGAAAVPWSIIDYNIVIQRRPSYYILTFVLPSFIITTISIIGVFAPFNDSGDREEKVTMGLTTLLTMTVMVTLIADKMPKSSDGMPLLGIYIMLQIGIAALSSLMAVIVMYQHCKWTYGESVPQWILTITRLTQKKGSTSAEGPKYLTPFDRQCNRNGFIKDVNDVNSSDNAKEREQQTAIFQDIQLMMRQIIEHLSGVKEEEVLRKKWQRAAQRLDLLLMLVFLVLNCFLTVGFLAIGYSNLITKT